MARMHVNTTNWIRCPISNRKHSRDIIIRSGQDGKLGSLGKRKWLMDDSVIVTEVLLVNSDLEGIGFEYEGHFSMEAEEKIQELAESIDAVGFDATFAAHTADI